MHLGSHLFFFSFSKVSDSHSVSSSHFLFCSPLRPFPFLHCQPCVPLLHLTIVFQPYLQILRVFLWLSLPISIHVSLALSPPWTINVQAYVASVVWRTDTIKESCPPSVLREALTDPQEFPVKEVHKDKS